VILCQNLQFSNRFWTHLRFHAIPFVLDVELKALAYLLSVISRWQASEVFTISLLSFYKAFQAFWSSIFVEKAAQVSKQGGRIVLQA
jgi:hypothetical protein